MEKKEMEGDESITFIHSSVVSKQLPSYSWSSLDSISILVVDDDTTCLTIVAAILRKFKYQVKHPIDALSTLRNKGFAFDLVVADVHMPDMNGFQLQQTIAQEFNLPVVLMSSDDKESIAIKGLESGAAYFILKPVMADDLRDLWQFAAMKRKSSTGTVVVEGSGCSVDNLSLAAEDQQKSASDETTMAKSDVSGNADLPKCKKDPKRKSPRKENCSEDRKGESSQTSSPQKRPKVIWTNSLHNRFLEAIRSIGFDRAVPKKILEVMNVPGLTRENVASHLQKYRIFLKRVSEASYKFQYTSDRGVSRSIRPSFDFPKPNPQSTLNLDRFCTIPSFENPGRQFPGPLLPSASSSLVGFGQSRLLGNKGNWLRPSVGNPNIVNQNSLQFLQNSFQPGTSIQGLSSNFLLDDLSIAALSSACLDTALVGPSRVNPNPSFGIPSTIGALDDTIVSSVPPGIVDNFQTNYVGYNLSNIRHLAELGQSSKGLVTTLDLPGDDEFQTSEPVEDINVDLGSSNSFVADSRGGELLSDVITDYQKAHNQCQSEPFAPLDLSEFDFLSNQELSLEASSNPLDHMSFTGQLNIQIQPQHNEGENIENSNFYSSTSLGDNLIPSTDQPSNQHQEQQCSQGLVDLQAFDTSSLLNKTAFAPPVLEQLQINKGVSDSMEFSSFSHQLDKTLQMNLPPEREDDDFLESLFASFAEDQNCGGL